MLELNNHQLSRIKPNSELEYLEALEESYNSLKFPDLNSKYQIDVFIKKLAILLFNINKDFKVNFKNDLNDILGTSNSFTTSLNQTLNLIDGKYKGSSKASIAKVINDTYISQLLVKPSPRKNMSYDIKSLLDFNGFETP